MAIVGAYGDDGAHEEFNESGAAYVFRRDGDRWVEEARLMSSDAYSKDWFGWSVAISGDAAIVGALHADEPDSSGEGWIVSSGAAYVFRFDGERWVEEAELLARQPMRLDYFGHSVAIEGNTAVVGARGDWENGILAGAVYVFRQEDGRWKQEARLLASDGVDYDELGQSVSISGDRIVAGACCTKMRKHFKLTTAYVYRRDGESWVEEGKLHALPREGFEPFQSAFAVSIWQEKALVGTRVRLTGGDPWVFGEARLYRFDGEAWSGAEILLASDGMHNDRYGDSVALSSEWAITGAPNDEEDERHEDPAGWNWDSGSAYLHAVPEPSALSLGLGAVATLGWLVQRSRRRRAGAPPLFVAALLATALSAPSSVRAASVSYIEDCSGPQVSGDGSVVAASAVGKDQLKIWRRSQGLTVIESLIAKPPRVRDLSRDGSVIIGSVETDNYYHPYYRQWRWTEERGFQLLRPYFKFELIRGEANAISADGRVVVGSQPFPGLTSAGEEGSLWPLVWVDGIHPVVLASPTEGFTRAAAQTVSRDGSVIYGGLGVPYWMLETLFRWTRRSGITALPTSAHASSNSQIHDATPDGRVLLGYGHFVDDGGEGTSHTYTWSESKGLRRIPNPGPDDVFQGQTISADGRMVGGMISNEPTVWTPAGGHRSLARIVEGDMGVGLEGWNPARYARISDDGTVLAFYAYPEEGLVTRCYIVELDAPLP